jgi:hypothetical protein
MAETQEHVQCLIDAREALRGFFLAQADVYVGANMLLYYEQGNTRRSISPDVFVVRGVGKYVRRTYKVWAEGRPPDFVLEITSSSTRRRDMVTKRELYAGLGVREYFLLDPLRDYLKPPLQGFVLRDGVYEPLPVRVDGGVASAVLGLVVYRRSDTAYFFGPAAGRWLLTPDEERTGRVLAEAHAETAEAHADAAEARADAAEARAQAAAAERQLAEARAQIEVGARRSAEEEVARLRAEIERLRTGGAG